MTTKLSIAKAARMAGIARSTLYERYIQPGKISVGHDDDGRRWIDASELIRVFPAARADTTDRQETTLPDTAGGRVGVGDGQGVEADRQATDTGKTVLAERVRALEALLEAERRLGVEKDRHIESLSHALRLLEYRPAPVVPSAAPPEPAKAALAPDEVAAPSAIKPPKHRLLARLFGR